MKAHNWVLFIYHRNSNFSKHQKLQTKFASILKEKLLEQKLYLDKP